MRVRRIAAIAMCTTVLLGVGAMSARGDDSSGLFGYSIGATGSAISFLYNQPSFGVPSDPTFELRKVYSLAALDSGPTAHGLGSLLWPGQVVGNAPPSLIFDTVVFNPTQIDELEPVLDQIKEQGAKQTAGRGSYPIRAESFYPSSQSSDTQDVAAGARMAATARQDLADGSSTTGGAGVPGVIEFGSIASHSVSEVINNVATASTITRITDLNLFGAIHINSIVATATATSDGLKGAVDGSLTIAGMTVNDQNGNPQFQINVDQKGVKVITYDSDGKPTERFSNDPLGTIFDNVNKAIGAQGFSLHVGKPIDLVNGAEASRSLAGLTIHLDAHGMNDLLNGLDKVVPGIKQDLQNPTSFHTLSDPLFGDNGPLNPYIAGLAASFFQGDQTMDVVFGSVAADSAASPPLEAFPIPEVPPITTPPITTPPFSGGGNFGGGGITTPPTGPVVQGLNLKPVGVVGIPFAALAVILLAGLIGATRLRLFADAVVAAPVAATRCPLEEKT